MALTDKQARFVDDDAVSMAEKLSSLRKLAEHIGLIAPVVVLRPSHEVIAERIDKFGEGIVDDCYAVITDKQASPYSRSACAILLECFVPDWREKAGSELLGMIVERGDAEVRHWRKSVLARDKHKCVECGSRSDLEAHHIVRWVDAPWLRIIESNGVTLCCNCHKLKHESRCA